MPIGFCLGSGKYWILCFHKTVFPVTAKSSWEIISSVLHAEGISDLFDNHIVFSVGCPRTCLMLIRTKNLCAGIAGKILFNLIGPGPWGFMTRFYGQRSTISNTASRWGCFKKWTSCWKNILRRTPAFARVLPFLPYHCILTR